MAGGICDSLMRPQGFCAYSNSGKRRKTLLWERKKEGKMSGEERCAIKPDKKKRARRR